jgi:ABC-type multidrug transport system ATPase subunit
MDVLQASSGSYKWDNESIAPNDVRKKIGTLLETPNFYPYLSAEKNLLIASKIKGKGAEDIDHALKLVNLYDRRHSTFSSFSLGMKQRLAIASALLGNPDILVFDEPTNGLDPAGIAEIRALIISLNEQGKTIIMASHILDEVEKVCSHVAIIQKGVLKTVGTVSELMINASDAHPQKMSVEISARDLSALKNIVHKITELDASLELICDADVSGETINQFCFEKGIVLQKLTRKRKSLETRFLEITGTQSDK